MNNSILTNLTSLSIYNDLQSANSILSRTLERMSSGFKINQAKDDASGCVISSKIKLKLNGEYQAKKNLQSGVSMLNVAQGAYQNMSNILMRLRNLSLSAIDDSYSKDSRKAFQDEANELTNELEQIRVSTKYNGISLFDNSNVISQTSTQNLATPEATNFSMKTNLIPKTLSIEDDSGGDTFEYGSDGNKTTNNDDKIQEVKNNNLALSSLNEEENAIQEAPMMMSTRSVTPVEKTTVTFGAYETKTINIGNNSYEILNTQNKAQDFTYQQDSTGKITFDGGQIFSITSLNNEANNIVLNGYGTRLFLNSANDIVDIKGTACYVTSEGGNNEIKLSATQTRLILNGNGNDTVYSSTSNANQYIYLGEGDDNIQNLKIDNSVITKKAGTTTYNPSNIKNCTLFNIEKTDPELKLIENASGTTTITINNKQYSIKTKNTANVSQHLFYKYDEEKDRIIFAGYNSRIQSLNTSIEKNLIYGVDNYLYGTSENDDILVGVGSYNNTIYGNDGNDLLVTEEFYTAYSNYLYGGNGDDTLIGNSKTGYWGEAGDDTIIVNTQVSSSGVNGGADDDYYEINGNGAINDTSGDNTFEINTNNLTINAGGSSGTFIVNGNNNKITGTNGDDTFEINGSNNTINGGNGDDYYINNNSSTNIQNALDATTNGKLIFNSKNEKQTLAIDGKTYTIINNATSSNNFYWNYSNGELLITGSDFDIIADNNAEHKIIIDGSNNTIEGGNKNDTITIKNGENNYILSNRGNDTINLNYKNNGADGGIGEDIININATTNLSINGNIGNDTINFNADNITNVQAGEGKDNITGITSNSSINLGNGNDDVKLTGNNNKIMGSVGDYTVEIEGNENSINLDSASGSIVKIKGNNNNFEGSNGVDDLIIMGNNNIANGNNGNDNFRIDKGDSNQVDGGMGRNILYNQGTNTIVKNMINITPKPLDIDLHIGSDAGSDEIVSTRLLFTIGDFELNFETSESAKENIKKIDKLLNQINEQMSSIGSALNRLDSIYELQNSEIQSLATKKSLIIDSDIAKESTKLVHSQILQQISASLFTQAHQITNGLALRLLGV